MPFSKSLLIVLALALTASASAQGIRRKVKKDSLDALICVVQQATEAPAEKLPYDPGMTELKLVISSQADTVARASIDGVISKVQRDDEGKTEIIYHHDDYWFWVSGITRADVRQNQRVAKGDKLGYVAAGDKIEIRIYDFETPLDPKKYMPCIHSSKVGQ